MDMIALRLAAADIVLRRGHFGDNSIAHFEAEVARTAAFLETGKWPEPTPAPKPTADAYRDFEIAQYMAQRDAEIREALRRYPPTPLQGASAVRTDRYQGGI